MTIRIVREKNSGALTQKLGDDILAKLSEAIANQGEARLAISGGSSPISVFEYLSNQELDWAKVKVTLVDDRCVPETHPDSNALLVKTHLLKNNASTASFISLSCEEGSSMDQAAAAEHKLSQHFPRYDVVILGMGADAHTASIFPEAKERDLALSPDSKRLSLVTDPVTAPHMRITQTLPQLLKTDFLAIHIIGQDKWKIIEPILEEAQDQYPISHFIHQDIAPVSVYCAA
jgi:6-phosphogluconolactonase